MEIGISIKIDGGGNVFGKAHNAIRIKKGENGLNRIVDFEEIVKVLVHDDIEVVFRIKVPSMFPKIDNVKKQKQADFRENLFVKETEIQDEKVRFWNEVGTVVETKKKLESHRDFTIKRIVNLPIFQVLKLYGKGEKLLKERYLISKIDKTTDFKGSTVEHTEVQVIM